MQRTAGIDRYESARKKRSTVLAVSIFLFIPLMIGLSAFLWNGQNYLIPSVFILCSVMTPFFMVFENRKPKAREIVLIACMTALTVTINLVAQVTIPINAGTAMVIISGIALGPEGGFLVGALARFICNFYQGQGAWTPWQMFCWGLLGFLAGFTFNKISMEKEAGKINSRNFKILMGPVLCVLFAELIAYVSFLIYPGKDASFFGWRIYAFGMLGLILGVLLQRKRLPLDGLTITVFTFLTTFIIYGGIMNLCAMVTSAAVPGGSPMSLGTLRGLYLAGAPYDALHAGTAALFVFLFGDSMIRKVERVKIKYGIYRVCSVALLAGLLACGGMGIGLGSGLGSGLAGGFGSCSQVQAADASYTWEETNNMAITTDTAIANGLPKSSTDLRSYVKWSASYSGAAQAGQNATTNAVFLNGRLYYATKGYLCEVNAETGKIINSAKLDKGNGYNYFLTTGGGYIYIQEGLQVEAFDENLDSKWVSETIGADRTEYGNQGLTPLNYANGSLYGGTVGSGTDSGAYFCINALSGKITWLDAVEDSKLQSCGASGNYTGFYWAGATLVSNTGSDPDGHEFLVYGSEGGRVYAVDSQTGVPIKNGDRDLFYDTSAEYNNSIRSSMVYADGYLYFVAVKGSEGTLYKLPFDSATGVFGEASAVKSSKIGYSIATPTVFQNRLYIGTTDGVEIYDITGNNLNKIRTIGANLVKIMDIRLVVDQENNRIYGFSQYYKSPGSIVMFQDTWGQAPDNSNNLDTIIDFGNITKSSGSQFCASMPIFGPDGTIYLTNDSGKLMALTADDANRVRELISQIGTVSYTAGSKSKIDTARKAYDALAAEQRSKVTNYGMLTGAETTYKELKERADATPKKQAIKSLKKASKAFTIKWTKNTKATGYQIQYASNAKFTKKKKTVTVTSYKTTSKKIKKLSKRTRYYVRVRSYKTLRGEKIYGAWSKTKKVTTK